MNEPSDPNAPALPGLEDPAIPPGTAEAGVRRQLAQMHRDGTLTEANSAHAAIALVMAQVVDKKHRMAKPSSTISNDARMVLDALTPLTPEGGKVDEELRGALDEWGAFEAEQRERNRPAEAVE